MLRVHASARNLRIKHEAMNNPFVHLRVHTAFSLCEGAVKIPDLMKKCVALNMPAIAMTDTNNMFGILEFSLKCADNGIQPIPGTLINLKFRDTIAPIVCLAKNKLGYKSLLKLMTCYYIENQDKGQYLTLENLRKYRDGLIVLSGGAGGPSGSLFIDGDREGASLFLKEMAPIFGPDFYIEISRTVEPIEKQTESFFIEWAMQNDIPLVATNDVYFLEQSMHMAHDALLCIADGTYITTKDRRRVSAEHYIKSSQEMFHLFSDIKEAFHNTAVIARKCSFMPWKKQPMLPRFNDDSGKDEDSLLEEMARRGLHKRLEEEVFQYESNKTPPKEAIEKEYFDRLEYEFSVIKNMGFCGYFLIVSDFVRWAKDQGIPVGPGRGSGAGSVVAWSVLITDLDPVKYTLIFERFLNPDRVSMPDFDIDFCQERRDEVIRYVRQKYGEKRVAHILALGTLQARAVIRDVGRVIQMPYGQVDKISKLVPQNPASPVDLAQALEIEPQFKQLMDEDDTVAFLIKTALQLEGLYRHVSTHAAGVVIGNEDVDELVPLYSDGESDLAITQFNMKYVESAGLVKFDFLGLKTLTLIRHTCDNIKKYRGIDIDISKIDLEDKKTLSMLCSVDVVGVFQLESSGMKDVVQKLQPDGLEDLIALVSLYRPGPIDDIPKYLARKHGKEEVTYLHPILEPILKRTYGVMVYQEQVMKIAQEMGGYSLAAADILRRAMGKKIREEMERNREIFISGATSKGIPSDVAKQTFALMEKFASYGFNRSHAAPYALLAYQTAFLKANFRHEFYISIMNLDIGNVDKISIFVQDAREAGITTLCPDVNKSSEYFTIEDNSVRYALGSLKGCSPTIMSGIVTERNAHGEFKSIFEFFKRTHHIGLSTRHIEALILSGAFDTLKPNRRQLLESIYLLMAHSKKAASESKQKSLFGDAVNESPLRDVPEYSHIEKLELERKAVGFYLSSHPMEAYWEHLSRFNITRSRDFGSRLLSKSSESEFMAGETEHRREVYSSVRDSSSTESTNRKAYSGELRSESEGMTVAGVLLTRKEKLSKNDQKYAFLTISDLDNTYEVTVFPELYARSNSILKIGTPLLIDISTKADSSNEKLLASNIQDIESLIKKQKVFIYLDDGADIDALYRYLESMEDGENEISFIVRKDNGRKIEIETKYKKNMSIDNRKKIASIQGVH
ncbi:MAG: DNA polymerase III subunit alpha [Holosporales bacterium]|nr:DNA polymerase III subunit alpha [Holosporales bacterium]